MRTAAAPATWAEPQLCLHGLGDGLNFPVLTEGAVLLQAFLVMGGDTQASPWGHSSPILKATHVPERQLTLSPPRLAFTEHLLHLRQMLGVGNRAALPPLR